MELLTTFFDLNSPFDIILLFSIACFIIWYVSITVINKITK